MSYQQSCSVQALQVALALVALQLQVIFMHQPCGFTLAVVIAVRGCAADVNCTSVHFALCTCHCLIHLMTAS